MEKLEEKLTIIADQWEDLGIGCDKNTLQEFIKLVCERNYKIYYKHIDVLKKDVPDLEKRIRLSLNWCGIRMRAHEISYLNDGKIVNNSFIIRSSSGECKLFLIEKKKNGSIKIKGRASVYRSSVLYVLKNIQKNLQRPYEIMKR